MVSILFLIGLHCAALLSQSDAGKILLVPWQNTSHYLELDGVGRQLVARNHTVYVLFDEYIALPKGAPYKLVTYRNLNGPTNYNADAKSQHKIVESVNKGLDFGQLFANFKELCINMFSDAELFTKLQILDFDIILIDNFFVPCYPLLPQKLNRPFVTVGSVLMFWDLRLPLLPSVVEPSVGLDMFGVTFCEETPEQLSIVKRLCRAAAWIIPTVFVSNIEEDYLHEYVNFTTVRKAREQASLALVNSNYLLSSPAPKLPHVEYVGGLTTRPAKSLEHNLEKWMSEAANVVVVSFGSNLGSLPLPIATKLLDAFGRLSAFRFLFRFDKQVAAGLAGAVPSNVRLMDWLPQNDALAHKSTRLFITHSGNNGQLEALYHGVPMLCFYVFADQKTNARRVTKRGYGKMADINDFTVDQLVADLTDLFENKTYSDKIKKASAIFHSARHPALRAADAVEHVLKYGGEHLRPKEAYKLTWWQFYMLDILAVVYVAALAVLFVTYKLVRLVLRCLLRSKTAKQKPKSE